MDYVDYEYIIRVENFLNFQGFFPIYIGEVQSDLLLFRATNYLPQNDQFRKKYVQHPDESKFNFSMGRCNFENQPIFYAANTAEGALMEKSASFRGVSKSNEKIFLSCWHINVNFYLVDFYFRTIEKIENPILYQEIFNRNNEIISRFPKNSKEIIRDLAFCGDRFASNGNNSYSFTSAMCNKIYRRFIENKFISGVTYTGATFNNSFQKCLNNYTNYALIPELIIKNHIQLVDVFEIEINGSEETLEIKRATAKTEVIEDEIYLENIDNMDELRKEEIFNLIKLKQ